MANTVAGIHLIGLYSAIPAFDAVTQGTLYSATDRGIVYRSNGSEWVTYIQGAVVFFDPLVFTKNDAAESYFYVNNTGTPAAEASRLGRLIVQNPNTVPVYVHLYNDDTLSSPTGYKGKYMVPPAVMAGEVAVPGYADFQLESGPPYFSLGVVCKVTTNPDEAEDDAPAEDCIVTAHYKLGAN